MGRIQAIADGVLLCRRRLLGNAPGCRVHDCAAVVWNGMHWCHSGLGVNVSMRRNSAWALVFCQNACVVFVPCGNVRLSMCCVGAVGALLLPEEIIYK